MASPTSPSLTIATRAPERAQPLQQRLVARPVEQDDGEVLHLHVHGEGDAAEVVLRRVADVDGAARLRAYRDLVHVGDRRWQQDAPGLGDGGDAERLAETSGHQADPVDREHREVDAVPAGADGPCPRATGCWSPPDR